MSGSVGAGLSAQKALNAQRVFVSFGRIRGERRRLDRRKWVAKTTRTVFSQVNVATKRKRGRFVPRTRKEGPSIETLLTKISSSTNN